MEMPTRLVFAINVRRRWPIRATKIAAYPCNFRVPWGSRDTHMQTPMPMPPKMNSHSQLKCQLSVNLSPVRRRDPKIYENDQGTYRMPKVVFKALMSLMVLIDVRTHFIVDRRGICVERPLATGLLSRMLMINASQGRLRIGESLNRAV